ncbi:hypothetical protein [Thalassotalea profundi]|uniref:Solute-binding protein family 3/N-terminal domain-containing protein n=1 Tax=Thalassotalea profundi TaxID=2036687 RepID=A0ABQ3IGF7_9GAMM|nr:hypothetical protein [Thalassotalea profundi]GHE83611.1 hypothetical protein GCM10011501_10230 [Thalassotalea profundi]
MDKLVVLLLSFVVSFDVLSAESKNIPIQGSSITVATVPNNQLLNWYKNYILKAYTDIGYKVSFVEYSLGKSVVEGNKGKIDALIVRTSEIEDKLVNFRRVPTVVAKGKLVLYCQKNVECSEDVLNERQNLIGIISGTNVTSHYMQDKKASVYQVKTADNVALMLEKKRFDYILTIDEDYFGNYSNLPQEDYNRIIIKEVFGYHYVHKKIAGLIPQLTTSLANAINAVGPPKLASKNQ